MNLIWSVCIAKNSIYGLCHTTIGELMRVSVILITGFLGSGKTTLLNKLLESKDSKNSEIDWAIVVNEFGDVGIDGELIGGDEVRQIELPGGCICCQLDEDLEKTIRSIIKDFPLIKQIVVETTGIAEPLPISWTLAKSEMVDMVRLGSVLTVVDASLVFDHLKLSPSTENQIEFSDILYISKCSLIDREQLEKVKNTIKNLNNHAVLVFDTDPTAINQMAMMLGDLECESYASSVDQNSVPKTDKKEHLFDSENLNFDDILDLEELTEALESLPSSYIRIKGMAWVVDRTSGDLNPQSMAFHRVGARVSFEKIEKIRNSKIVAIGDGIEKEALSQCVEISKVNGSHA